MFEKNLAEIRDNVKSCQMANERICELHYYSIQNALNEKFKKETESKKYPDNVQQKIELNLKRIKVTIKKIPQSNLNEILEKVIKTDTNESISYILNHYR